VHCDNINKLERGLDAVCKLYGFPEGEEFKWSPNKKKWMYASLVGKEREEFFQALFNVAHDCAVAISVIVIDTTAASATDAKTPELDAVELFLERISNLIIGMQSTAAIVVDQPGGGAKDEREFLSECLNARNRGTEWVQHDRIAMILTGRSAFIRCLQLADIIASCVTQRVGGESLYSPSVFSRARSLMTKSTYGAYGGAGLKIHPDFTYRNLYYWLLNDSHFYRNNVGNPLPLASSQYGSDDGCEPEFPF
jgi:hypothetical protein